MVLKTAPVITDTKTLRAPLAFKDPAKGEFSAIFSTFDVVDLTGDIILASAVEQGVQLPVLWAHDHFSPPVAVGVTRHAENKALIDGHFILDSQAGRDAHAAAVAMQKTQEMSWAFKVLEVEFVERDGKQLRIIKKTQPFEVSFVLRGAAGPGRTGIVAIKDHGLTFSAEAEAALDAVHAIAARAASLAEMRATDGRGLGAAAVAHLGDLQVALKDAEAKVAALTTAEPRAGWRDDVRQLHTRFLRAEAALRGVPAAGVKP